MKSIIVFYSLGGSTKRLMEQMAKEKEMECAEITEVKRRSKLAAFIPGIIQVAKGSSSKINEMNIDFTSYDEIVIASPIWASHQVPAINAFIEKYLPEGKKVTVYMVSMSGTSEHESIKKKIEEKKCEVVKIEDIKTGTKEANK